MSKLVLNNKDVRDKILNGVRLIADPVVQTLSPRGGNVLFEDSQGGLYFTNDGVSIAKEVNSPDPVEDAIIKVIRGASLKTNHTAGDGTSTTILLSQSLIKDGYKLLDEGVSKMELRDELTAFGKKLREGLKPYTVESDDQILNIARISSNNDQDIAGNILKVVKTAGESGLVFIEPSNKPETEIEEDMGYVIEQGMFAQEFANKDAFTAVHEDVHVLVTDKRIYYEEEAETIIRTALEAGIKNLVVVARDFIGKAPNVFLANHNAGVVNLLLIKHGEITEQSNVAGRDLATYLGGSLVTERDGKLVDNLKPEQFIVAKKVYSTPIRTVLMSANPLNPKLQDLIDSIKKEDEDKPDDEQLERRLAVLTSGIVTIKVGGATPIEVRERIFRYEDAVNATRSAMKHGYLVGGGLALLRAFDKFEYKPEYQSMFQRFCYASVAQIAKNCDQHVDSILRQTLAEEDNTGFNAKTGQFEDLLIAGVIDPYKVTESAIENAISVAIAILTSEYIIVTERDNDKD